MKPVQAAGGQSPVHAPQPRGACSRQVHVLARMRELEVKNTRLKRTHADLALKNAAIKDVLGKILTLSAKRAGGGGHGDRASPVATARRACGRTTGRTATRLFSSTRMGIPLSGKSQGAVLTPGLSVAQSGEATGAFQAAPWPPRIP